MSEQSRGEQASCHSVQMLRPIGTPLPATFIALALASMLYACLQLGWLAQSQSQFVAIGVLTLSVPLQALGSVIRFLARDAAVGTGSGILAGTWAATAVTTLTVPRPSTHPGLGVLLLAAGALLVVPAVGGFAAKPVAAVALVAGSARLVVTGVYELHPSPAWMLVAGSVGIAATAIATYAAMAFILESATGVSAFVGRSRQAVEAGPPGVRDRV